MTFNLRSSKGRADFKTQCCAESLRDRPTEGKEKGKPLAHLKDVRAREEREDSRGRTIAWRSSFSCAVRVIARLIFISSRAFERFPETKCCYFFVLLQTFF